MNINKTRDTALKTRVKVRRSALRHLIRVCVMDDTATHQTRGAAGDGAAGEQGAVREI